MIDVVRGGFLSDNDRSVLDRFPVEIAAEESIRCFSLGERDLELVWDRVGPGARLVGGLQIGALRLFGFVPDDVMSAPSRVVGVCRVSGQGNGFGSGWLHDTATDPVGAHFGG